MFPSTPLPPMPLACWETLRGGGALTGPLSKVYKPRSLGVLGKDPGEGLHGPFPGACRMGSGHPGQEAWVCPVQSLFLEYL